MAVYKRKNMWYIDYYINVNGKRERRREPVSTRKDVAENRLREYREMIKAGNDPKVVTLEKVNYEDYVLKPTDKEIPTLNQFIPVFMKLHSRDRSKKMQESYRFSLGHLVPVFGKVRLNNITKVMV